MGKTPQLVMGAVQLGMPYGAANVSGMPSESAAIEIVRRALRGGIHWIDTARAYGEAERRVGLATSSRDELVIVTKLDPLTQHDRRSGCAEIERAVLTSLETSRSALRRKRLQTVLLHRAAHMQAWDGIAWRIMKEQRAAGAIERIGVSVTTTDEAFAAIADDATEHVQLPFNLLDRRWRRSGVIDALRQRPDVVVHVRSVFLQGLLNGDRHGRWPIIDGFSPAQCLAELRAWSRDSVGPERSTFAWPTYGGKTGSTASSWAWRRQSSSTRTSCYSGDRRWMPTRSRGSIPGHSRRLRFWSIFPPGPRLVSASGGRSTLDDALWRSP